MNNLPPSIRVICRSDFQTGHIGGADVTLVQAEPAVIQPTVFVVVPERVLFHPFGVSVGKDDIVAFHMPGSYLVAISVRRGFAAGTNRAVPVARRIGCAGIDRLVDLG